MSARDYATGDELADLNRNFERALEKLELRVESELQAMKIAAARSNNVVAYQNPTLAVLHGDVADLRKAVLAMGKVLARHQHAIEELSL